MDGGRDEEALVDPFETFEAIEIPQQSLHAPVAEAQSPDPSFNQSPERQTINQTLPLSLCVCLNFSHCMMPFLTNTHALSAYFQLFSHCHFGCCSHTCTHILTHTHTHTHTDIHTPTAETILGVGILSKARDSKRITGPVYITGKLRLFLSLAAEKKIFIFIF